MEIYPALGLAILVLSFATQFAKTLRTKHVHGISPWAMGEVVVCSVLFGGYYLGNGHFFALALNALLVVFALGILGLYFKYRWAHKLRLPPQASGRCQARRSEQEGLAFAYCGKTQRKISEPPK